MRQSRPPYPSWQAPRSAGLLAWVQWSLHSSSVGLVESACRQPSQRPRSAGVAAAVDTQAACCSLAGHGAAVEGAARCTVASSRGLGVVAGAGVGQSGPLHRVEAQGVVGEEVHLRGRRLGQVGVGGGSLPTWEMIPECATAQLKKKIT